jgi:hypothetical protein
LHGDFGIDGRRDERSDAMTRQHGTLAGRKAAQHPRRSEHAEPSAEVKGGFRVSLSDGAWWWSPGMYTLHGYQPPQSSTTVPTTRLLLAHRHPADRPVVAGAWSHLLADGGLVAFHYRIVGFDGVVRPVFAMASTDYYAGRAPTIVTGVIQLEAART